MEKERPFNFKLLVPPRISTGQVFAVRPQEVTPHTSGTMQPVQAPSKCSQKDLNNLFQNTSMVASSKSFKSDAAKKIAVMPMGKEEKISVSSDLCSKLLEEFEKINSWKLELDSEIARKDKLLHENKRTIENQRKAIQELQFENETLSIKLENQMCENAELKNKGSETQNLCTILNDAFERSVEKMSLFESERLETHELFIQNSETIQRIINAFEGLRDQTESDKLKFKEELKQYEDIEQRFQEELKMKEEEVAILWVKMNDKDNKLQEVLKNFRDKEEDCIQLQEAARQHYEMLQMSKQDHELLLKKLQKTEESQKDIEKKEMEYIKTVAEKDSTLDELYKIKDEQKGKLLQIQTTAQELQESLRSEMQRTKDLEEELMIKASELGETVQHKVAKENEIKILREDMDVMSKSLILLEEKLQTEATKVSQLDMDLKNKNLEISELLNKACITSVEKEFAEKALNSLQEELMNLKEIAQKSETKLCEMAEKLHVAQSNELQLAEENNQLKKNIEQNEYKEVMAIFNKFQLQNERITEQAEGSSPEKENNAEEETEKEIERLKEENIRLRDVLEPLKLRVEEQDEKMMKMQENYEECLNSSKLKTEKKTKAYNECLKANNNLKKQLATEREKCNKLDTEVNEIKEQLKNIQSLNNDKLTKLQAEIKMNAVTESELYKKVEKLNLEAQEAVRIKEETEIKCQHKISDMVALMEKHKNQYDKMIEEKDSELDNRRLKEAEANASYTSLVLELSETKIENLNLKRQLENEVRDKDKLKQEITDLNLRIKSVQEDVKEKTPQHNIREICCSASQETQSSVRFMRKSALSTKKAENGTDITDSFLGPSENFMKTPPIKESGRENLKTQSCISLKKAKTTPRIKSYRIRTPPSTGKSVPWIKTVLEFDSTSDSSEQQDLLSFLVEGEPNVKKAGDYGISMHHPKSPTVSKSPGVALKLAAVKRMRDAGWTAVTSADMKKKKKASEKIFA
ncbi:synaptonemal complex protein 1 isoform X2 [Brienomyrus brachyistius]|uniref:synaptonemal complex protein 1 isoform X2 n=1 Tax=Brienomyrus brachyistius TaxID=42636 RepID=UPI0020B1BE11|nr:synaptonemal complex protein 1 isoform X2 [Brienomyrus brachyistius]